MAPTLFTAMDPTDWATLEHLLTSNIAPLHHECATTQTIINKLNTALTTLDDRTASLQQELKQLAARRLVIEDHRHRCAGILSARRRLPPKVTQVIMGALWSRALHNGSHQPSQSPIPRLMLVSREWHDIALATPHFWANLSLNLLSRVETTVEGAGTWLSRAQSHPLSLRILLYDTENDQMCLAQFLERWVQRIAVLGLRVFGRSLDVAIPNPHLRNIIWPELHTLIIRSPWRALTGNGMDHQLIGDKSSVRFPALRNVHVRTLVDASIFSIMGIPWGNLVSLNVDIDFKVYGNHRYLAMLRECSGCLQEISMTVGRHIPLPLQRPTEPIIFPHLTRLFISPSAIINLMDEEWIVGYLRFPALRSITYHLPPLKYRHRVMRAYGKHINSIPGLVRSLGATKSIRYFELRDDRRDGLANAKLTVRMQELFEDLQNLEHFRVSSYLGDFEFLAYLPKSVQRIHIAVKYVVGKAGMGDEDRLKYGAMLSELSATRRDLGCPVEVVLDVDY